MALDWAFEWQKGSSNTASQSILHMSVSVSHFLLGWMEIGVRVCQFEF
jgi:hypothetical protein